ncbi:PREDICTED: uncharacterized protein LOC104808277 isoform X2 [Tarenaya hassleriana]|uniref:uncharacterized protein LOC104808277 isoform X2 n=1 Tax=Tarenaya hassleriana TaxID=28532 RepID=UPI00053C67EA|nr:PREDICTED: uncharacterized protein LOC104808277 isoform X2 [Tarenaya hassleriana]
MFGGGRGPMGGGGGGGMLRAAGRAMKRTRVANGGIQEPFSSSSSSSANAAASNASHGGCAGSASRQPHKLSSSSGSNHLTVPASGSPSEFPVGGRSACVSSGVYVDEFEWVSEEGSDEEFVFGCVPSADEVQDAVSALRQFEGNVNNTDRIQSPTSGMIIQQASPFGLELDWLEPPMQLCHPRMLQTHGYDQVYNAFHLLRTEPSVQKMVVSLSSDRAVWEAVMNNEVVREIRELYNNGTSEGNEEERPGEENKPGVDFIKWVFDNTKAKAMEVMEKISKLVAVFFKKQDNDDDDSRKDSNELEERIRTSVLLTVTVMLVVIVSRASPTAL